MISKVLASTYTVLSTEGNHNNHVGVPLTLFRLRRGHDIAVVEVGTNHPGEIAALRAMVQPTHALVTNIGKEHLEYFGNLDSVALEETALWHAVRGERPVIAFVNADDPLLVRRARGLRRSVRYGIRSRTAGTRGSGVQVMPDGSIRFSFIGTKMKAPMDVHLRIPGRHAATNALAAAAVGLTFRVKPQLIRDALQNFSASNKRMEVVEADGVVILNDTYNANPDSMLAALQTLAAYPATGKRIAVLADMLELGTAAVPEHERIGEAVAGLQIDFLLTYGSLSRAVSRVSSLSTAVHFEQKNALAEYLLELIAPGDVVLIKGSRGMKMEDVAVFLQERRKAISERA